MTDLAIRVEDLGKLYHIGAAQRRHDTLRDALAARMRRGGETEEETRFWALRDVSFQVRRGEVVGVIGRNGAGKSTLLKILSRITEPTTGYAEIHGRVGSLLEVGTGFHPELTGRENVYLSGAILGMRRTEIDRRFDAIVNFSGVERFLDIPFKRYSSGMRVRLGFAVAAHLDPEILLIDEVLAVGDVEFQKRCLGKMEEVAGAGRTVLFVSHSLPAVGNLCGRAVLLDQGKVAATGQTQEVITRYLSLLDSGTSSRNLNDTTVRRVGSGEARFARVSILSLAGDRISRVAMGQGIRVRCEIVAAADVAGLEIAVSLYGANGTRLCGFNSHDLAGLTVDLGEDENAYLDCAIPGMNIMPGKYHFNLLIRKRDAVVTDHIERAVSFDVVPEDVYGTGRIPRGRSVIFLDAQWEQVSVADPLPS